MKIARTAEQSQKELMSLSETVLNKIKPALDTKGYEIIQYLDGELDEATPKAVMRVLEKINQKAEKELAKGKLGFIADLKKEMKKAKLSIVFMQDDQFGNQAIPDIIVKKKNQNGQDYAALIEITKGIVEIKETSVSQELDDFANQWETERKSFAADPAFDQGHFGYIFSADVTVYHLFK